MPVALEQFAEETIEELLKQLPAERLLKRVSPADRLSGLSVDQLLAAMPAATRAALEERIKDKGSLKNPDQRAPGSGDANP